MKRSGASDTGLTGLGTNDPHWGEWSVRALAEVAEHRNLAMNPIIYAGLSIRYSTIEALVAAIPASLYRPDPLPWTRLFAQVIG